MSPRGPGRGGPRHMPNRPPSEFEERVVQIDRVARVVKGGRRFRFRATVVIGDRKGRVGLGVAKSGDVQGAIQKSIADAKKNMITVKTIRDTIPFAITARFAGAQLLLKPARPGTGIIAGGAVRPIVELAGITNILSKSLGSDNRINNAKAAVEAFKEIARTDISALSPPAKEVAKPAAVDAKAEAEDVAEKAEAAEKKAVSTAKKAKSSTAKAKPEPAGNKKAA